MSEPSGSKTLIDLLGVLRRRKWIIVQAALIVPVFAVAHAVRQPPVYASSAQVLLSRQNVAATFAGVNDPTTSEDPVRYAATQAFLARSPSLLRSVVRSVGISGMTKKQLAASSSVVARTDADILSFSVQSGTAAYAQALAGAYAQKYVAFRREHDTATIRSAQSELDVQIKEMTPAQTASTAGQALLERRQQLQTLAALESANTFVSRPAQSAYKISPRPKRDGALGFAIGLVLGIGLAFLREAFDTRIRTSEDVGERLGLPLLARIVEPPRELIEAETLVMIEQPYSTEGEAYRMLRTSLDLTNLDHNARSIMVTSASEGEGKTPTACNLAVVIAASGRSVAVVDLDLRRPAVDRYFGVRARPGLTEVALQAASLDDALVRIEREEWQDGAGELAILPSGFLPPNPSEFAAGAVVGEILGELVSQFDMVIVDTPPVLHAAEAIALSARLDAILVVARLNKATRNTLTELRHALDTSPATKLGFVFTGAEASAETYGSPYAYPDRGLVA